MTVIQYGLNDYHCIKFKTSSNDLRRLIPNDTLQEHIDSIVWLDNEFNNTWEGPTVVVTHHAPSIQSIASIFKADKAYNTGYASNLESHIKMWKPEFWLHGHMHLPFDYMVDNTRVICNPSGYTDQRSDNYGPKIIEI
jgi:Icc-related predicted phosphoesterase